MRTNLIVVDDFYSNPHQVREFALNQEFSVTGNFPGTRTKTFMNYHTKDKIQNILENAAGNVIDWFEIDGFSGSFQITTAADRSWIHTDHFNTWAGVCYLTPDAPLTTGTTLYRHKKTGSRYEHQLQAYDSMDTTHWEAVDRIGNVFNRLILYRSDIFHRSTEYFGSNRETGRLFQLFFFSTAPVIVD